MTDNELTRRDALAALAASGIVAGGVGVLNWAQTSGALTDHDRDTMQAVAHAIYPSELDGIDEFVERVAAGRANERPDYAAGISDAVDELDEHTRHWEDVPYVELSRERQAEKLREFGVHQADPDPDGYAEERVRYYLVNELLFALYSSPTGGDLVGIENPQGHPGGTASYQRPPSEGDGE